MGVNEQLGRVMRRRVTGLELEQGAVVLDVPHGDLLARLGATLAHWRAESQRLMQKMGELEALGLFLDASGEPVVPSWWEHKEDGRHVGWYLVWPAEYAKRAGRKQREPVKASNYEAARKKVWRTTNYIQLKTRRDALITRVEAVGHELSRLVKLDEPPGES